MLREELIRKVREKTVKSKKIACFLRRILVFSKAKKSSKSLRLEAQSMVFMQGVIIKHLTRQILVADSLTAKLEA